MIVHVTTRENIDDKRIEKLSFEDSISQLEETVRSMESGEAPLESIVSNYQRGVKLLRHCKTHLDNAELKIKEVSSDSKEKNLTETEDS